MPISVRVAMCNPLPKHSKGGAEDAENVSTEKASEKKGAWLQKENENRRRQKCPEEKTCKRQKKTDVLICHPNTDCRSQSACESVFFIGKNYEIHYH